MITCTRRIQFCSGHRVYGHEGKCKYLHGHNYVMLVTACANELDSIGRVIDFSVLKEKIGGWIDLNWDHGCVLWEDDFEAVRAVSQVAGTKMFLIPSNPTAENMADYILRVVCPEQLAGTGVVATKVVVWETENCYAEAIAN